VTEQPVPVREPKGTLERLLSPIADVHPGEAGGVLLMTLIMLLLLGAYYMLKTARESLILTRGGAEVKTYAEAGQALLLLFIVPAFAALASRVNRIRLMQWVTLFFVSNIVLFVAFSGSHLVGLIYYVWLGIFSVMVIAQFWGFAADLYTPSQGKRLFPLIGLGSSLGAWLGAVQASRIIGTLGPFRLMTTGGVLLLVCMFLATVVHRMETKHPDHVRAQKAAESLGHEGAFGLIRRDRYLVLITVYVVIFNIIDASGDYIFSKLLVNASIERFGDVAASAPDRARFVGAVFGRFYSYANLVGLLMQMFLVSRIFKWVGIGRALFIHPIIELAGYVMLLAVPSVRPVGWFKVVDKSTDYSLGNTAKQALWLPTSRAAKFKAKQAVDSFFVRLGDVIQAGIVYLGTMMSFGVPAFAILNLVLAVGWLSIARALRPIYDEREAATEAAAMR
jgi:AAA family ATP:ADP antiporter